MASSPTAAPMPAAPTRRLDSGPATAISPSALGEGASLLRRAIPPRSHSSMPSVWTPKRRATRAWASSWKRIDAKKAATPTEAVAQ